MSITTAEMQKFCETVLSGRKGDPNATLNDYLAHIPRLESLADVPSGTPVLVRGDVDAKPGKAVGEGDIRLRSMVDTLKFGQHKGWKQIIFGHIGRKPEGSLDKVAKRIGELLGCEATLIKDWYDPANGTVTSALVDGIASAKPGAILVLENTRAYDIERVLWDAKPADAAKHAATLAKFANEMATKVADVYVNEALSAGSLDSSTVVVPAAMKRVALGKYVAGEFSGPMQQCLKAQVVVFSGLKIDKLDDLAAMIGRGTIRRVFAAGSLAMALRKAIGEIEGKNVCIGEAEDPSNSSQPYYIPPERVAQAKQMVLEGREKGIEFIVPCDSIIGDGSQKDNLDPNDQQFDIGPKTSAHFEAKIGEFLATKPTGAVAFHNGVFGMFEDPRFEEGTRRFMSQLKRLKDAGVETYIGGGEGGIALEKYGQPDWVNHVFTAGGTVLNALGSEPVPYLVALRLAAKK